MADFTFKQGDLEPSLAVSLVGATGFPVDVSAATDVRFRMGNTLTRVELFSRIVTIEDPVTGQLVYDWQAGDTDVPGVYYGEFVVNWALGRPQTYPESGYLVIAIEPKL